MILENNIELFLFCLHLKTEYSALVISLQFYDSINGNRWISVNKEIKINGCSAEATNMVF